MAATLRSGYPFIAPTARYALTDPLDADPVTYFYRPALNNGRLPLYSRVDVALGYSFRFLGLEWDAQAQAYNLFNQRNTVGFQYALEAPQAVATGVPGLPLLPMAGLKARW